MTPDFDIWPHGPPSPPPAEVKLVLSGARTVRVQARDSSGQPLAGIDLFLLGVRKEGQRYGFGLWRAQRLKPVAARTDAQGVAVFDWLPKELEPGPFSRIGFELVARDDYFLTELPVFDPAQPKDPVTAKVLKTVSVSGKVTLPDGEAAAGILVGAMGVISGRPINGSQTRTNGRGEYTFKLAPNDVYILGVLDDDWAARDRVGVLVKEGEPHTGLDFRLGKGTVIAGTFTGGKDKTPAPEQIVELTGEDKLPPEAPQTLQGLRQQFMRHDITDKDGRFRFRVGPGRYRLSAFPLSAFPIEQGQELVVGAEEKIEKDLTFSLPYGRYSGSVRTRDGKPVPGARVLLKKGTKRLSLASEARTDANGNFAVAGWRSAGFLYACSPDSSLTALVPFGQDEQEFKVVLGEAAQVKGRLVDARGKPLAKWEVEAGLMPGPQESETRVTSLETRTDAEGRFSFAGLVVGGSCSLLAVHENNIYELKEIKVDKGGVLDVSDLVVNPQ